MSNCIQCGAAHVADRDGFCSIECEIARLHEVNAAAAGHPTAYDGMKARIADLENLVASRARTIEDQRARLADLETACRRLEAQAAELDRRLRRGLVLLREFYVAWGKPEWAEGVSADEYSVKVRLFLDEQAMEGLIEAEIEEEPP